MEARRKAADAAAREATRKKFANVPTEEKVRRRRSHEAAAAEAVARYRRTVEDRRTHILGELGRVVQVDPIKPSSKAPGSGRLKLEYDEFLEDLLSTSTCAATARHRPEPTRGPLQAGARRGDLAGGSGGGGSGGRAGGRGLHLATSHLNGSVFGGLHVSTFRLVVNTYIG